MDDVPEGREDDVTRTDVPVTRPESSGPASDRVRIVGAEPAGEATNELPAVPGGVVPDDTEAPEGGSPPGDAGSHLGPIAIDPATAAGGYGLDQPTVRLTDEPGDPGHTIPAVNPVSPGETAVPTGTPAATELPHWTEPPTGKVPAVLSRDAEDEGSGSAIVPPTWREEDADWVAHDEEFEPAMFGSDQAALGSLDETDRSQVERRPWEFDLDSVKPGSPSPHRGDDPGLAGATAATDVTTNDPITEPTDVVASAPAGPDAGDSGGAPVEPGRAPDPGPVVGRPPAVGAAVAAAEAGTAGREEQPGPVAKEPILSATDGDPVVEGVVEPEKPRPTGSARLGRARRNGLRPARHAGQASRRRRHRHRRTAGRRTTRGVGHRSARSWSPARGSGQPGRCGPHRSSGGRAEPHGHRRPRRYGWRRRHRRRSGRWRNHGGRGSSSVAPGGTF